MNQLQSNSTRVETGASYLLNAGVLYGVAKKGYHSIRPSTSSPGACQNAVLTAVFFSAATLEAGARMGIQQSLDSIAPLNSVL